MTRKYTYTFFVIKQKDDTDGSQLTDWYKEEVVLTKVVTDRMEERGEPHKRAYAVNYFNEVLRSKYGYKKSVVNGSNVECKGIRRKGNEK